MSPEHGDDQHHEQEQQEAVGPRGDPAPEHQGKHEQRDQQHLCEQPDARDDEAERDRGHGERGGADGEQEGEHQQTDSARRAQRGEAVHGVPTFRIPRDSA